MACCILGVLRSNTVVPLLRSHPFQTLFAPDLAQARKNPFRPCLPLHAKPKKDRRLPDRQPPALISPAIIEEVSLDYDDDDDEVADVIEDDYVDEDYLDGYDDDFLEGGASHVYAGDGGEGGGISLAGTWWDKEALAIAEGVSSPGVERVVRIPQDLERFKDRPMHVKYVSEQEASGSSPPSETDGIFRLISFDMETSTCTWGLADVRKNREKAGKGRPLSKKQREWRLDTPFDSLRLVRLYSEM